MKNLDYEIMIDRIFEVMEENEDKEILGVAQVLTDEIMKKGEIGADILYELAEYYGCSLDYLTGRSDTYSIF